MRHQKFFTNLRPCLIEHSRGADPEIFENGVRFGYNIFANVFVRFPLSVFNSLGVITHHNVHSRNQDFAKEMLEHKVKILCQENVSSWRSAEQTGANQSYVS